MEPRRPAGDLKKTTPAASTAKSTRKGVAKNVAVMTLATGLVATLALPAYAFSTTTTANAESDAAAAEFRESNSQNVIVPADAAANVATRDNFTATTPEELAAARAAEQARQIAAQREQQRTQLASYSGPGASDFLANPPYPSFDGNQVVAVARQYLGVPYVYGGATPAGFDCSGLTMYVYAQFGISLPHSSARQGANGAPVSAADAQPGDLVILDGGAHVGIYSGNGMMIDAPMPGRVVTERAIYSSNHYFVRYTI